MTSNTKKPVPQRARWYAGPLGIGLLAGLAGLALTLVGIVRGTVSNQPASIAIALLIGFGVWFLIAWAVAAAAQAVEQDMQEFKRDTDEHQN